MRGAELVVHSVLYPPWDNTYGIDGRGGGFQKFQMESMEWGMDSILFQDGIHGMGDGLHNFFYLFHKSRLKMYMVGI